MTARIGLSRLKRVALRPSLEQKGANASVSGLETSATARSQLAMSSASQWGISNVSPWEDSETCRAKSTNFETLQRNLQPLPTRRSEYNQNYDMSSKLKHNPRGNQPFKQNFSGSRVFDHAQNFNSSRKRYGKALGGFRGRPSSKSQIA